MALDASNTLALALQRGAALTPAPTAIPSLARVDILPESCRDVESVVDLLTSSSAPRLSRRRPRVTRQVSKRGTLEARIDELRWYDGEGFRIEDNDQVLWRPEGYTPHRLDDFYADYDAAADQNDAGDQALRRGDEKTLGTRKKKLTPLRTSNLDNRQSTSSLFSRISQSMSSLSSVLSVLAIPAALAAAYWLFVTNGPTPVVRARHYNEHEDDTRALNPHSAHTEQLIRNLINTFVIPRDD